MILTSNTKLQDQLALTTHKTKMADHEAFHSPLIPCEHCCQMSFSVIQIDSWDEESGGGGGGSMVCSKACADKLRQRGGILGDALLAGLRDDG